MGDRISIVEGYLPSWLAQQEPIKSALVAVGTESGALFDAIQDLLNQCFVDTATWGLDMWESFLAIPTDTTKPYDYRRSVIKAKITGVGTTTIQMIKDTALSYQNGSVDVIEDPISYSFVIKFTSLVGTPPNFDDFQKTMNIIIPAHLSVSYLFTYNTYAKLATHTYSDLTAFTYDNLRNSNSI